MGGVGFPGGAVYIRNDLIRTPLWRSATSLAGPAATLVVLLSISIVLAVWENFGMLEGRGPLAALLEALTVLAFLQATALILNLLPIPGLDGFGAIRDPSCRASLHAAPAQGRGLGDGGPVAGDLLGSPSASGAVLFRAAAAR